jgi:hypothetical protein
MKNKEKKTIESSISHLNGYAEIIKNKVGCSPLAVLETISKLKDLIK